jgi:L-cysteine:1D-myo-inositol 2-amino-2-deoxy-alpha-D-glucopyranoside ligase
MDKGVTMRLRNSLTGKKEVFTAEDNHVSVYVCGVTPYDITHLGHAFTYTHFDVLVRYLRYLGYRVTYVQNLTDIDDDILRKAKELGEDWRELGEKNADRFLEDMKWLGNLQPDVYPRATDVIPDIINLARDLLAKGWAYEKNGSVYFKVHSYKPFGRLSKLPEDQWLDIANERGNHPKDPNKQNPIDFVLWQSAKEGEPSWSSPWGVGRPGWHIECSVMSTKFLGSPVDIKGGGGDLIFPHHECSLAQSECATGKPLARYWVHTGMVRYRGEKMSKSLGNMVFVKDLKELGPNATRLCLLNHHYGRTWLFDESEKKKATKQVELFQEVWRRQSGHGSRLAPEPYEQRFHDALADDLDTPSTLRIINDLATEILRDNSRNVADAKGLLNRACTILGLEIRYGESDTITQEIFYG